MHMFIKLLIFNKRFIMQFQCKYDVFDHYCDILRSHLQGVPESLKIN